MVYLPKILQLSALTYILTLFLKANQAKGFPIPILAQQPQKVELTKKNYILFQEKRMVENLKFTIRDDGGNDDNSSESGDDSNSSDAACNGDCPGRGQRYTGRACKAAYQCRSGES